MLKIKYYRNKNYIHLIDIESKISDIIFKIFTILFIGVLGISVSIYNLKLNNEKKIYELLTAKTKQIEQSHQFSIERYLEPMLFAQKMSGIPFSKNMFLDYLSSNDSKYQQINSDFRTITNQFKTDINKKFRNINLVSSIFIVFIIILFFIYLFIQIKILKKLIKYKKYITKQSSQYIT